MGLSNFLGQITVKNFIKSWKNPRHVFYIVEHLKIPDFNKILFKKNEYEKYINEIENDKINREIEKKLKVFDKIDGQTSRGYDYTSGIISTNQAHNLYCILRSLKPEIVIETGVLNGYSSTYILHALHKNKKGKLYSIDFPEVEGAIYENGTFWDGKGGGIIPKNKQSGWLVPDRLRPRWELILGKTQDKLPKLVKKLSSVDIFIHDSEHSYETMTFEYTQAWSKMSPGGTLFSHDIRWNTAFFDFAKKVKRKPHFVDYSFGFITK